jgi:hypothetical protein
MHGVGLSIAQTETLIEGEAEFVWTWPSRIFSPGKEFSDGGAGRDEGSRAPRPPRSGRPTVDDTGALHEVLALLAEGSIKNENQALEKLARGKHPYNRPGDLRARRSYKERLRRKLSKIKKSST